MIAIEPTDPQADWPGIWKVLEPAFRAGDSYPIYSDVTEADAKTYWFAPDKTTFVARNEAGDIIGTYYIRPNQGGIGSHICNCGFVTAENARGQGVASKMCEHSQDYARQSGYRGMQYNLVVATNEAALHLWKKQGFGIVGRLPGAFEHKDFGFVDAFVMFKGL